MNNYLIEFKITATYKNKLITQQVKLLLVHKTESLDLLHAIIVNYFNKLFYERVKLYNFRAKQVTGIALLNVNSLPN